MRCDGRENSNKKNVVIGGYRVAEVKQFCFLYSKITKDVCSKKDIKIRRDHAEPAIAKRTSK